MATYALDWRPREGGIRRKFVKGNLSDVRVEAGRLSRATDGNLVDVYSTVYNRTYKEYELNELKGFVAFDRYYRWVSGGRVYSFHPEDGSLSVRTV